MVRMLVSIVASVADSTAVRKRSMKLEQPDNQIMIPSSNTDPNTVLNDPVLSASAIVPGMAGMPTGMVDEIGMDYGQASYDVFDPLNWMLDGIVEFPYSFSNVQGNDISGMESLGEAM